MQNCAPSGMRDPSSSPDGAGALVPLPFFLDESTLSVVERLVLDQADHAHVRLDGVTDFRDQRRHVAPTLLEVSAAGVEHRSQLLDEERHVTALAKHRGHDSRERHDPLEVLHVLRVDEDLERGVSARARYRHSARRR